MFQINYNQLLTALINLLLVNLSNENLILANYFPSKVDFIHLLLTVSWRYLTKLMGSKFIFVCRTKNIICTGLSPTDVLSVKQFVEKLCNPSSQVCLICVFRKWNIFSNKSNYNHMNSLKYYKVLFKIVMWCNSVL